MTNPETNMQTLSESASPQVPTGGGSPPAACSAIEWGPSDGRDSIRGYLRGHPETTLFLIRICDDRADRGTMTGAFVPDEEDGKGNLHRGKLEFLKAAAEIYLLEFYKILIGVIESPNVQS